MNEHYYSPDPNVKSQPRKITFHVRDVPLTLVSDAGVFSKVGLDFGTRLLIETVELPADAVVVDLGCGYGVVGAVLSRVFPRTQWFLLDINQRAVELAEKNTRDIRERVKVLQSDGLAELGAHSPDAILLNPPIRAGKKVVYRLFEECQVRLQPGGTLWVVMHKKHGAESAVKFLGNLFDSVEVAAKKSGYLIFRCEKTKPVNTL